MNFLYVTKLLWDCLYGQSKYISVGDAEVERSWWSEEDKAVEDIIMTFEKVVTDKKAYEAKG